MKKKVCASSTRVCSLLFDAVVASFVPSLPPRVAFCPDGTADTFAVNSKIIVN